MYEFDYDQEKSQKNLKKHGIDFDAAKLIWEDSNLIEIPAKSTTEARYLVVGKIDEKHWSAVITYRTPKIRIISVRRSRKAEVTLYES